MSQLTHIYTHLPSFILKNYTITTQSSYRFYLRKKDREKYRTTKGNLK